MEITHNGPFPNVSIGGIFVGYGVPEDHFLFGQHAFSFLDDDGVKWYFVYEESIKPKSFSDAELAAEFYRSMVDFQSAHGMLDLIEDDFYKDKAEDAREQMFLWEGRVELPSVWEGE